jgi:DNA-directed RNA polymerase specialized sigma24 family protein
MDDEGCMALIIAILHEDYISPEKAFDKLHKCHDLQAIKQMAAEGMTYREIGEVYGVSRWAIHKRLKRFKPVTK